MVAGVSFASDGKYFVSGSQDKTLKLWNTLTGENTRTLTGHSGFVSSVAFSPELKRIVSAAGGSRRNGKKRTAFAELIVWDVQTGKATLTL